MHKAVSLFLLSFAIASAQHGPSPISIGPGFPPQLTVYLELTNAQVAAITKANSDLFTFRSGKMQRQIQVQIELMQETARQTVDPTALGLRYAELEVIRREIAAEQQKAEAAVQSVLTAAQKAKLGALQQSLQLYSLACLAVGHNVLNSATPFPGNIIPANRIDPTQTSYASFLLGRVATSSCGGTPSIFFNPILTNSDDLANQ